MNLCIPSARYIEGNFSSLGGIVRKPVCPNCVHYINPPLYTIYAHTHAHSRTRNYFMIYGPWKPISTRGTQESLEQSTVLEGLPVTSYLDHVGSSSEQKTVAICTLCTRLRSFLIKSTITTKLLHGF